MKEWICGFSQQLNCQETFSLCGKLMIIENHSWWWKLLDFFTQRTFILYKRNLVKISQAIEQWTRGGNLKCLSELKSPEPAFKEFEIWEVAQTWLVPHDIVFSVSRLEPALNWNRILAVQRHGLNTLNSSSELTLQKQSIFCQALLGSVNCKQYI